MRSPIRLAFATFLLLSAHQTTLAQDTQTGPRTLTPRALSPVQNSVGLATPAVPAPVQSAAQGINVQTLGTVSRESLGILSGRDALPNTLWQGSERIFIETLLAKLPAQPAQPYLRVLQRRLLLSAAQPPKGQGGETSLLTLRAQKIAAMGHDKDLQALVKGAPQNARTLEIQKLEAESALVRGDFAPACALGSENQRESDIFWAKTMAFCRLLAQQPEQAQLALSLLQEMGDEDPIYYQLMDALTQGKTGTVTDISSLNSLHIGLIRATKAKLPDNPASEVKDARVLLFLAEQGDLTASFRAANQNLLSPTKLAQHLMATKFTAEQMENALSSAETMPALEAQALLYQVAHLEGQLDAVKTEVAAMALELAKNSGYEFAVSRLYQKMIGDFAQTIDLLWFAPTAFQAQLSAGNWKNAHDWYVLLRNAAFTDPKAAQDYHLVRPLAVLAGFDMSTEAVAQTLSNWLKITEATPKQRQTLFALIDGLGHPIGEASWLNSMFDQVDNDTVFSPTPTLWIKMNKAALANHSGETLLLALSAFLTQENKTINPVFLRDLLFNLRALGLEQEARILAVETALRSNL